MLFQLCTYQLTSSAGKPRMGIAKVSQFRVNEETAITVDYIIDCATGVMVDPRKLNNAVVKWQVSPLSFIDTRYTGG